MITSRLVHTPTILEDGQIQLREEVVYEEDSVELFRKFHRRVLEPGVEDVASLPARLRAICEAIWTPDVITEYQRKKAEAFARQHSDPDSVKWRIL